MNINMNSFSIEARKLLTYLIGLVNKSPTGHKLQTRTQARTNKVYRRGLVTDEEFDRVYTIYVNYYNSKKNGDTNNPPPPISINKNDFEKLLDNYVNRMGSSEPVRSYNSFLKLTKDWTIGRERHSMQDWYNIYLNKVDEQPGNVIQFKGDTKIKNIAFHSKFKIDRLKKLLDKDELKDKIVTSRTFPLERNKKFYLHKLREPNSYIIDIMFEDKLGYLVAIECNSRYLYVDCLNRSVFNDPNKRSTKNIRTTTSVLHSLQNLINKGMRPHRLTGDAEGSFASKGAIDFYNSHNIIWEPVNRMFDSIYPDFMNKKKTTSPLHSSLGIIDRVIRTLRDMAFNTKTPKIIPTIMDELVEQYNNAPHRTLSEYAGQLVSPRDMMSNQNLYNFICRKICQTNFNIEAQKDFNIPIGTEIKVYNNKDILKKRRTIVQPGRFWVEGFSNGLFIIKDEKNHRQRLPRYRIEPLHKKINVKIYSDDDVETRGRDEDYVIDLRSDSDSEYDS